LASDELAPRRPRALTGRPDPGADHDLADARRGDLDRETKQLAGDPPLPPPRVLPSEPHDQLANLQADPGTTATPPRIRPATSNEPAVPGQQRFRGDEQRAPPRPGEQPARCSQESTVGGPHRWGRYL